MDIQNVDFEGVDVRYNFLITNENQSKIAMIRGGEKGWTANISLDYSFQDNSYISFLGNLKSFFEIRNREPVAVCYDNSKMDLFNYEFLQLFSSLFCPIFEGKRVGGKETNFLFENNAFSQFGYKFMMDIKNLKNILNAISKKLLIPVKRKENDRVFATITTLRVMYVIFHIKIEECIEKENIKWFGVDELPLFCLPHSNKIIDQIYNVGLIYIKYNNDIAEAYEKDLKSFKDYRKRKLTCTRFVNINTENIDKQLKLLGL